MNAVTTNAIAEAFYNDASKIAGVPPVSAHVQLAAARDALDRQLKNAEATIADIRDRKGLLIAEHIRERETRIAEFRAEMQGIIARERADVQRLETELAEARARRGKAENDLQAGLVLIADETAADHAMAKDALDAEEQAALILKAAAEGALSAMATVVKTDGGAA